MPGLNVDLNVVPPSENQGWEGTSTHTRSQDRQEGTSMLDAPIDLEAYEDDDDDDVIISSPRAFAEAKSNSRKNRGLPVVVDVDAEERSPQSNQTSCLSNQTNANSGIYVNLEDSNDLMTKRGRRRTLPLPPPKAPIFNCPICMGPFVEEMSTKCGHIFCNVCIRNAIAAQKKCPTCRMKITLKNIFRIYLPSTYGS